MKLIITENKLILTLLFAAVSFLLARINNNIIVADTFAQQIEVENLTSYVSKRVRPVYYPKYKKKKFKSKSTWIKNKYAKNNYPKNNYKRKNKFNQKDSVYSSYNFKKKEIIITKFDVNMAGPEELQIIYGVGNVMSNRIVRFRDKLGGFYSLNQLSEVYGMKPEVLESAKKYLNCSAQTAKIEIQQASFKQLIRHPYIDKVMTNKILSSIKKGVVFTSVDQLIDLEIIVTEDRDKFASYFQFELELAVANPSSNEP